MLLLQILQENECHYAFERDTDYCHYMAKCFPDNKTEVAMEEVYKIQTTSKVQVIVFLNLLLMTDGQFSGFNIYFRV